MANFQSHLVAGAVVGSLIAVISKIRDSKPVELQDIALAYCEVCIGAVGGVLPDRLEPAIHPRHRKLFHSFLLLGLIAVGLILLWENDSIAEWVKWLLTALAVAFIIHLGIDGFTPAGLPVA